MNRVTLVCAALLAGLLYAWGSALAHHSVAAEFDTTSKGELQGRITRVWFSNPHVRYQLTVDKKDGSTEIWELQGGNVTNLRKQHWTVDSIHIGDKITVSGLLGRGGTKKLLIRKILFADGRQLPPPQAGKRPDRNAVNASQDKRYGYPQHAERYPIDITGIWRDDYKWHTTVNDLTPKPTPFTPEGKRLFAATKPWQDYSLRCVAPGLPRIFGAPYNMDIVDGGDHYVFIYIEHNTPRRIWMDGRKAPSDTPATPMGFSVGHWEGDVLVIETTHLSPGWLDGSGLPMSGKGTRTVERYEFSKDRLTIKRTMTIYDAYYTQPLVRHRGSARGDDLDITEQAPCDPDSYYRDLSATGKLAAHFAQLGH